VVVSFSCTWYCMCNCPISTCRKSLVSSQCIILIFIVKYYIHNHCCSSVDAGFGSDVCLSLLTYDSTKCFSIRKSLHWWRHLMDRPIFRVSFASAIVNLLLVLVCEMGSTLWLYFDTVSLCTCTQIWHRTCFTINSLLRHCTESERDKEAPFSVAKCRSPNITH
jgi:hypothetical protein